MPEKRARPILTVVVFILDKANNQAILRRCSTAGKQTGIASMPAVRQSNWSTGLMPETVGTFFINRDFGTPRFELRPYTPGWDPYFESLGIRHIMPPIRIILSVRRWKITENINNNGVRHCHSLGMPLSSLRSRPLRNEIKRPGCCPAFFNHILHINVTCPFF